VKKELISVIFILILSALMFTINPVCASYQGVNVLIAYDEEFEFTPRYFCGYGQQGLADRVVTEISWMFDQTFNIKFIIAGYLFWDSDDAISNINEGGGRSIFGRVN